ncbi:MAG: ester cyclase [Xanthomonadales bacterium]|nr:ester cyclase [Xanthomonadales bacterium]
MTKRVGAYGAESDIVDYILGITFEIWEQRGVELIEQYYAPDCVIYGLDGITRGNKTVVHQTWQTLESFPDRLLLAENVIWSGNREDGYYSSHRLLSRMTNRGPTRYGPATGNPVRMTNIADCVIEDGVITREWLVRDNMTLATQLGAEPLAAARLMARERSDELSQWFESEIRRVREADPPEVQQAALPEDDPVAFAWRVLDSCWSGDRAAFDRCHAPYSVLHRSPFRHYSGRDEVFDYYRSLRNILGDLRFSVDHVAAQPFSSNGVDIAVRWTVAGTHEDEVMGVQPTGRPLFVLGVTHWRCIAGRVAIEMTIFDDLAVLGQTLDP